jgi:hypothetical protein
MKMKRPLLVLVLILAVMSLACSINVDLPEPKTGPTETVKIAEDAPSTTPADVTIGMGGGKLTIGPGSDRLVEGTVDYNISDWKPEVNRSGNEVSIEQSVKDASFLGGKVVNNWDLRLGKTPMDLTIQAGAYEGELDLSGLALRSLRISDGASKANVTFNLPNPDEMTNFTYSTGASNVDLEGLLNANFREMNFKGGAGNFSLDFSGAMTHEVKVFIEGGLGNMTLVIPKGLNAQINVSGGLNNVSTQGTWTIEGQEYHTIGTEGPLLKIQVNMGVGNLRLENQ